jgi:hypothetical protein
LSVLTYSFFLQFDGDHHDMAGLLCEWLCGVQAYTCTFLRDPAKLQEGGNRKARFRGTQAENAWNFCRRFYRGICGLAASAPAFDERCLARSHAPGIAMR